MRYLSVCSGIEAASVAWEPLGWTPVGFAEIDKAASRVLAHRFGSSLPGEPLARDGVPNFGDFTAIDLGALGPVDLLVGGTPCQSFSVAGKRLSLADARGNLSLAYAVLAYELARSHGLRWALWENVPGVLSTDDNAFGCLLGGLVGADDPVPLPAGTKRWPDEGMVEGPRARAAWRILDAQYFGLPQRRRRVYVVVGFGDGADPAKILFEPKSLRRDPAPRGKAGQAVAGTLSARPSGGGGLGTDFDLDGGLIAHSLRGEGFDASEDGTGRGIPLVPVYCRETAATLSKGGDARGSLGSPGRRQEDDSNLVAFDCHAGGKTSFSIGAIPGALRAEGHGGGHAAVAYAIQERAVSENLAAGPQGLGITEELAYTLEARHQVQSVGFGTAVRRLTPRECHRLQGFPEDWCAIPGASDGAQYKQLGNSMAVAVMAWLGARIDAAERNAAP